MPTDVPGDVAGLDDTLSVPPDSRPREPDPESTRRIGPYRLLHLIGEGGMGEVWVGEQLEPVRRKVALKVIKAGMDTKQVVARFEAERQALALMDHPAIAKVLDGGSTPEGRPYFVMEHVPGVSLTEHCDGAGCRPRSGRALHGGVRGSPARPSEGRHPPRSKTLEHSRLAGRRAGTAENHRLRDAEGDRAARPAKTSHRGWPR